MDEQRWDRVRRALQHSGGRFQALILSGDPAAMATRDWTVADSAAHVLSIASHYVTLLGGDPPAASHPFGARTNVDTVRDANASALQRLRERDPVRLAGHLRASVDDILSATSGDDPARTVPWLGNSRVPVAGVLAHLVNEFLVHGWDIARGLSSHRPMRASRRPMRASRRPMPASRWPMPDEEAATFIEEFLFGMIRHDYGALLDHGGRPPRRRIGVEFRSAHTATGSLILQDGRVRVGAAGEPVDARVTFRPARLNLMLFGRLSTVRAVARRDVVIGGPRPWLLPSFLHYVHMPRN